MKVSSAGYWCQYEQLPIAVDLAFDQESMSSSAVLIRD
jgi:hypothetical protein